MKRKLLSLILILSLLCCVLPVNTLAAGESTVTEREEPLPLPPEASAPMEGETVLSVPGGNAVLAEEQVSVIYLYQGRTALNLSGDYTLHLSLTDPGLRLGSDLRLQVRDGSGAVLGSTDGSPVVWFHSGEQRYHIDYYSVLFFSQPPAAGSYSFVLFDRGSGAAYEVEETLTVLDSGILFDSLRALTVCDGDTQLMVSVSGYGPISYQDLSHLQLELVDGSVDHVAARSDGKVSQISLMDNPEEGQKFNYVMRLSVLPGERLEAGNGHTYLLRGSFQGSGLPAFINTSRQSVHIYEERKAEIVDVVLEDEAASILRVKLNGCDPDKVYRLRAEGGGDLDFMLLGEWEGKTDSSGEVSLQLKLNGKVVPFSQLPDNHTRTDVTLRLEEKTADIMGTAGYSQVSVYYYSSCYYFGESLSVSPFRLSNSQVSIPFILKGFSRWNGPLFSSGNVVTLRDLSGKDLGSCTDVRLDPVKDTVSGVLSLPEPIGDQCDTAAIFLNGTVVDTLPVVDHMIYSVLSYSSSIEGISANMGELYYAFNVIGSSGSGYPSVWRKQGNTLLLTGDTVQGTLGPDGLYYFTCSFSSQALASKLKEREIYIVRFTDSRTGRSILISEDYYIKPKRPFDPTRTSTYSIREDLSEKLPGHTALRAVISVKSYANMSRQETEDTLKEFKLRSEKTGAIYNVSSVASCGFSVCDATNYEMVLLMDGSLPKGYYSVMYRGQTVMDGVLVTDGPELRTFGYDRYHAVAGTGLPADARYTGELYRGFDCVSPAPFPLYLHDSHFFNEQYLTPDAGLLESLCREYGTYQLRVFIDGEFLGEINYKAAPQPELHPYLTDGVSMCLDTVVKDQTFYIQAKGQGDYNYIRAADSPAGLKDKPFQLTCELYATQFNFGRKVTYGQYYWEFEYVPTDPGPRTLYIEYSRSGRAGDAENRLFTYDLLYLPREDFDLGLQADTEFTFSEEDFCFRLQASTAVPQARVWAELSDGNGNISTKELEYAGQEGGRTLFTLELQPYESLIFFYDFDRHTSMWGGLDVYEASRVRLFATTLESDYKAVPDGKEKVLSGVSLRQEHIILSGHFEEEPKLVGGQFVVSGIAPPWETVSIELEMTDDDTVSYQFTERPDEEGIFSVTCSAESGEFLMTVTAGDLATSPASYRIVVDADAPQLEETPGVLFNEETGTALIVWRCEDTDGDLARFEIYREGERKPKGTVLPNPTGVYAFSLEDGEGSFTVAAYDVLGNAVGFPCRKNAYIVSPGVLPEILLIPGELSETRASVDLFGNSGNDGEMYCVLAAYDAGGRMLSSSTAAVELAASGMAETSVELDKRAVLLKAFLLEKGSNAPKQEAWGLDLRRVSAG